MIDVHDDLVAALAGRYEIEREIGHGGMATVYLARDVRHDRHVALKVLRADLTSSLGAERFVREINIAARLSHPHILALYDSGTAGNTLYYVMPHVAGETLRQRLDREHQLPLDEAMAITRQIASALDYAHAQGVVHRDIKPENILLLDDHVLVADFGLARALYSAASTRLTGSAVAVGTPAYMSPEQAAADPQVDGRTDVYSLACVLFEMVTGSPPFHGATVQALMMHHLNSPPPSMCAQRTACPPWVDEAVQRALAKMPADRFRTAAQFARALDAQAPGATPVVGRTPVGTAVVTTRSNWWRKRMPAAAAAVVLGGGAYLGWLTTRDVTTPPLDETRYYVARFERRGAAREELANTVRVRVGDALAEWRGLTPIVGSVAGSAPSGQQERDDAVLRATLLGARAASARWLVSGDVTEDGDSVAARASLHDVSTGKLVRRSRVIRHASAGAVPRALYRQLVNELLRSRTESPWSSVSDQRMPTLPAWMGYDQAREALQRWDLPLAERELARSIAADPQMALSHLWLAHLGQWAGAPPEAWLASARRAVALRDQLSPVDSGLAEAQLHLAEARYPAACAAYQRAIRADSIDYRGWLGLGDCQARDSVVLESRSSRSGYAFRSSYHAASQAYLHARARMETPHPPFVYQRIAKVLLVEAWKFRPGRREEAPGLAFAAFPALSNDTLAFVPFPMAMVTASRPEVSPVSQADALARNRRLLETLYLHRVQDAPRDVDAHVALASLLEMLEQLEPVEGRASALGEVATARSLSPGGPRRLDLGRTQVRLLVKTGRWRAARILADSLLGAADDAANAEAASLAGIATLTGKLEHAVRLRGRFAEELRITTPNNPPSDLPDPIRRDAMAVLPFAEFGICDRTVTEFPQRLERRLESYYSDAARARVVRDGVIRRVLRLAVPCGDGVPLSGVESAGERWVTMAQAIRRRDAAAVRREFDDLQRARHGIRPGENAIEGTFVEAWLLAQAGDSARATAHLDHTLGALQTVGTQLVDLPSQSAGLVRAMALRAELAAARGDQATASQWATAVVELWHDADPPLQPIVHRMRKLVAVR